MIRGGQRNGQLKHKTPHTATHLVGIAHAHGVGPAIDQVLHHRPQSLVQIPA